MKKWLYEFWHGHPRLLKEEVDIICEVRFHPHLRHASDYDIQQIIKRRIKQMYKEKFKK